MAATTLFSSALHALTSNNITISGSGANASSTGAGSARTTFPKFSTIPLYAEFNIVTASSSTGSDSSVNVNFSNPVISVAVTIVAGVANVWLSADGISWNNAGTANPATGVGANIFNAGGAIFAGASFYTDQNPVTFNFGQSPFLRTPPSGFSAWGATETIASVVSGLVLGPDSVTAYPTENSTWQSALTTGSKASGSWYFEVNLIGNAGNGSILGFGTSSANLNSYLGSNSNSCGMQCEGDSYGFTTTTGNPGYSGVFGVETSSPAGQEFYYPSDGNANGTPGMPLWASGATVGVYFNPGTNLLWWTLDGTNFNGTSGANPATGADGISVPGGAAQLSVSFTVSGSEISLNTTGPFALSVASGFYAWDGGVPPVQSAQRPTLSRRLQDYAAHFRAAGFPGRAPRPARVPAPQVPAAPQPARVGRLQRLLAHHLHPEQFAGRAPKQVAIGPRPVVPPTYPVPTTARLLRTHATHFALPKFEGRRLPRHDYAYGGGQNLPPRASQIVAETLLLRSAGARASQLILEALSRDPSGARASQIVVEALYQQTNPTYVRASQVVIEVLVPFTEMPVAPIYPALIGLTFDVVKRIKWSTGTGQGSSGREIRVGYWSLPQWEWDLTYDILADTAQNVGTTASDIKTLIGFVLNQYGAMSPFYFQDPDDNAVTGQQIGVGDGTTKSFTFVRTYGQTSALGTFDGTEPVGGLNMELPISVYVNGVAQESGITINNSPPTANTVVFSTAPAAGAVVTADFSFYYYCRLLDDSIDFNKFMSGLWNTKKLTIYSLKSP